MIEMERQKNTQMFVIAILAVAILTMSVGFALYSSTLNITGNANLAKAKWSIVWEKEASPSTDYKYSETTGSVQVDAAKRTFTDTDMTFEVDLKPEEFYEFTVYAKNAGTFNANLKAITLSDVSAHSKYLKYEVYYNGTKYTSTTTGLSTALAADASVPVKVRVEYVLPEDEDDLPKDNDVKVTLSASFDYEQA